MDEHHRDYVIHQDDERQQPVTSANDSDYFSEGEGDSPVEGGFRQSNRSNNRFACSDSNDWIEQDLPVNSPRSLSFLTGSFLFFFSSCLSD